MSPSRLVVHPVSLKLEGDYFKPPSRHLGIRRKIAGVKRSTTPSNMSTMLAVNPQMMLLHKREKGLTTLCRPVTS
jgi:hypothetical protein